MFGIGLPELLIILGICVLLFGARRLPEIGSGIGKAIKNFKSGVSEKGEIDVTPDGERDKVTDGDSNP
jgi:sec-independent protein translocase protein TatA